MFNILVTDDEQIVIDSLSFIINKNFNGETRIFTALSGTEAIEIVMKEKIDIIFMDINMPGLNGLETVNVITKLKPNVVFIILSAFDRFQYAQEAINLGAYKYITKPVNRNTVIQTIKGAMQLISEKQGKLSADLELHKKLDLVSPMIENDFIYACIFTDEKNIDLSSYLEYFNLSESFWVFCCFEFPNINSENQYKTYLKIHELLNTEHRCLVSTFMMNRLVVFFPIYSTSSDYENVQHLIRKAYSTLSYNIGSGIRCGVSSIEREQENLQKSYTEALSALNKTDTKGGLLFSGEMNTVTTAKTVQHSEFKNQILNKLVNADATGAKTFLELYTSEISGKEIPLDKIKNSFFELIVTANNFTKEIDDDFKSNSFDNAFAFLRDENDINRIKEFTQGFLIECIVSIKNTKKAETHPIIKKVCDYVDQNISQEISLEQMAEKVERSSFYLSKLFREEKGETFISFVSNKRLEKACQLLTETNLSIKEITAKIGYNDQNYFSRIFKNKYGLTPKNYRKIKTGESL